MFDQVAQIFIFILSGLAIWMVGRPEEWKRWGYILGLLSQPFWFYSAYSAGQWGMFLLSIWFTFAWVQGINTHWNLWRTPRKVARGQVDGFRRT